MKERKIINYGKTLAPSLKQQFDAMGIEKGDTVLVDSGKDYVLILPADADNPRTKMARVAETLEELREQ